MPPIRPDIITYVVQKGDTLAGISAYFGVSDQTILNANPKITRKRALPGQKLTILPVSGVRYTIQDSDTAESIAAKFGTSPQAIARVNAGVRIASLQTGTSIIIPGDKLPRLKLASSPVFSGSQFLKMPTEGFNWRVLHNHNAVDIANSCGTPVKAAADGIVVPDPMEGDGTGDWNGGYGHFVMIDHQNGIKTRYAHLNKILVSIGDIVKQGQEIGTMGQTGEATGCHLHFEVYGATNPFAKQ